MKLQKKPHSTQHVISVCITVCLIVTIVCMPIIAQVFRYIHNIPEYSTPSGVLRIQCVFQVESGKVYILAQRIYHNPGEKKFGEDTLASLRIEAAESHLRATIFVGQDSYSGTSENFAPEYSETQDSFVTYYIVEISGISKVLPETVELSLEGEKRKVFSTINVSDEKVTDQQIRLEDYTATLSILPLTEDRQNVLVRCFPQDTRQLPYLRLECVKLGGDDLALQDVFETALESSPGCTYYLYRQKCMQNEELSATAQEFIYTGFLCDYTGEICKAYTLEVPAKNEILSPNHTVIFADGIVGYIRTVYWEKNELGITLDIPNFSDDCSPEKIIYTTVSGQKAQDFMVTTRSGSMQFSNQIDLIFPVEKNASTISISFDKLICRYIKPGWGFSY